ncbi:hypothetical protein CPC08DRAFT_756429, partial [Agrocybe pediades]
MLWLLLRVLLYESANGSSWTGRILDDLNQVVGWIERAMKNLPGGSSKKLFYSFLHKQLLSRWDLDPRALESIKELEKANTLIPRWKGPGTILPIASKPAYGCAGERRFAFETWMVLPRTSNRRQDGHIQLPPSSPVPMSVGPVVDFITPEKLHLGAFVLFKRHPLFCFYDPFLEQDPTVDDGQRQDGGVGKLRRPQTDCFAINDYHTWAKKMYPKHFKLGVAHFIDAYVRKSKASYNDLKGASYLVQNMVNQPDWFNQAKEDAGVRRWLEMAYKQTKHVYMV